MFRYWSPRHRPRPIEPARGSPLKARVFVSYKRGADPDDRLATALVTGLEQRGHTAFYDKKIPIGLEYPKFIENEIAQATAMIVLLSSSSTASEMGNLPASEPPE